MQTKNPLFKEKEIILGVTGSIAAYKAAELIGALKKEEAEVTVMMTESAKRFITPLTLRTISKNYVYHSLFTEEWNISHISLATKGDLILIAPATANIIAKLAAGFADDLLTAVCLSTKAPILIAPAMNSQMYANPILQENIKKLKKSGYRIIPPVSGTLACGEIGEGRLASIEAILKEIKRTFEKSH